MRITYCDLCGAKIVGEPCTITVSRPFPLIGSADKEYETCGECAEAFLKKGFSGRDKRAETITGTVKVDGEKLARMEVRDAAAYLDSYRQGAEAALLEELKKAGAITYTAETGSDPREPLGGGRYSALVDVVMPKTAKEETTND